MALVWDEAKRLANLRPEPEGHGLDFADARDRFAWETALVTPSYSGRDGRPRFLAIGYLDGSLRALVLSPLGDRGDLRHQSPPRQPKGAACLCRSAELAPSLPN